MFSTGSYSPIEPDLQNLLQIFHFLIKRIIHFGSSFIDDHRRRWRLRSILTAEEKCTLRWKSLLNDTVSALNQQRIDWLLDPRVCYFCQQNAMKWPFVQVTLEVYITPQPLLSSFSLKLGADLSIRRELTRMSDQPVTWAPSARHVADRTLKEERQSLKSVSPFSCSQPP